MLEILVFHTTKVLVNRNVISFKNFKQIQQFILNLKFNKYYYAKHVILQISKFLCPEIGLTHYYAKLGFSDKGCACKQWVSCLLAVLEGLEDEKDYINPPQI